MNQKMVSSRLPSISTPHEIVISVSPNSNLNIMITLPKAEFASKFDHLGGIEARHVVFKRSGFANEFIFSGFHYWCLSIPEI